MHHIQKDFKKQNVSRWNLNSDEAYLQWRKEKLDASARDLQNPILTIGSLSKLTNLEKRELFNHCRASNMAIYQCGDSQKNPDQVRNTLRDLADNFGLRIAEKHRSAGELGIVALTISDKESQRGYIPYSNQAINWHTDGYYNGPKDQIRAMVLHCVNPAKNGGRNQLIDSEIVYIRLRDENPEFIAALMHSEAMTIPENRENDGSVRVASVGPVFSVDPQDGQLCTRYTARKRSIAWRDDPVTLQAAAFFQYVLEEGDPLMRSATLAAGQGVLCNNVLHNRTGFERETAQNGGRLMFRVRFHNRIAGS